MLSRFQDRHQAGRVLARHLEAYAKRADVLVLALPRGGVPIGFEVGRALQSPLLPGPPCGRLARDACPTEYRAIALGCSGSGLALKGDLSALSKTTNMLSHDPIPSPSPIHTAWRTVYVM